MKCCARNASNKANGEQALAQVTQRSGEFTITYGTAAQFRLSILEQ
jgi:hypothetical protein